MELSFIIVSWNVSALLRRAIESMLADAVGLSFEIIVVDNASTDGTADMLRAAFPPVRLIANTENVGFTRANNQALAVAQGRFLFLLNPDAELERGAVRALRSFMDAPANGRVGIAGPQLVYPDHRLQSSRRRFPTLATALLESTPLQQWFPRNRVLDRYYVRDTSDQAAQDVDWLVGAALFVRRAVYDAIGGFDERFFMYSEELDWCQRAHAAGWRVVYVPQARVVHYEARSSEQVVARRDIYFHSSKVRYFKKYHGAQGEALRWFLLAMFGCQTLAEGSKYLLGHKRELRAARVKAYRQVLASGLR